MTTECTTERLEFERFRRQRVVGRFDGGELGSDGGGLLLRELALRRGLFRRLSACFRDHRDPQRTQHPVEVLVAARVLGLALGYEDLIDHGHVAPEQAVVAAMRGGETGPAQGELGSVCRRQEHAEPDGADGAGAGRRGTLQEDRGGHRAAGCPAGGPVPGLARGVAGAHRAGRGRDGRSPARPPGRPLLPWVLSQLLLLAALYLLRPAVAGARLRRTRPDGTVEELERIVGRIRKRWPGVEIWLRGDSGFCRDELLAWCEAQGVSMCWESRRTRA